MEAELKRLARRFFSDWKEIKPVRFDPQTLVYPYSDELAWLCVNYMRTPSRVLADLFESKAKRLESLYEDVCEWMKKEDRSWLEDEMGISVRARDVADFPASRAQIQGTLKNGIIEGAHKRALTIHLEPDDPDILISIRGSKDTLVVSVDLAGRSMHERGYRLSRVKAPIRENIAAQILMLARWNPRYEILLDPMCGSGTFLIEGVCMARAMSLWTGDNRPAVDRLSAFAEFDRELAPLFDDTQANVFGNDMAAHALKSAKKNCHNAKIKGVRFCNRDFEEIDQDVIKELADPERELDLEQGLIVCNPPYGARLEADTVELYKRMGQWFSRFGKGWRAAVIVANPEFDDYIPFKRTMKKPLANASMSANLFVYDLGQAKAEETPRYRRGKN